LEDWLEDIATVTNSTVVNPTSGMKVTEFDAEWFGYARKITVTKEKTEILSYMDDIISERVEGRVKELMCRADTTAFDFDRDRLRERASSLDGGLCILKVGGYTEQEAQDRRSRTEDALHAVRACLTSGVVPGAGRAYHFVSNIPELEKDLGGRVLAKALEGPLRVLTAREGLSLNEVFEGDLTHKDRWARWADDCWVGWDPLVRSWRDFRDVPQVVDPTEVVLQSILSAVSVACQILLTEVVIPRKT
jgi:chaperonin GroEL